MFELAIFVNLQVYVRATGPEQFTDRNFVRKVVFHLHESFPNPIREIRKVLINLNMTLKIQIIKSQVKMLWGLTRYSKLLKRILLIYPRKFYTNLILRLSRPNP